MIVKPLSAEITLNANNNVSSASCVRIYNSNAAAAVITNESTSGSFTMPTGSITFVVKQPTEELSSSVDVKATSVAFTIS
jgi:hypothetical protein